MSHSFWPDLAYVVASDKWRQRTRSSYR